MSTDSVQVKLRVPAELNERLVDLARKQSRTKTTAILGALAFYLNLRERMDKRSARRAANDECVDRLKRAVELPVGARFLREMGANDVDETLAIWRPGVPTEPIAHIRNGQVVESTQYVPTIWDPKVDGAVAVGGFSQPG
jgi:hypothetical protein